MDPRTHAPTATSSTPRPIGSSRTPTSSTSCERSSPSTPNKRLGTRAIAAHLNAEGKRTSTASPGPGTPSAACSATGSTSAKSSFRDVIVADAHPALVDDRAVRPMPGDPGSPRRSPLRSGPRPTPTTTSPDASPARKCGRKYIGTSATGKLRRYRYYTCFTRARYGTVGCTAARIDADLIDNAITEALIDFYQQHRPHPRRRRGRAAAAHRRQRPAPRRTRQPSPPRSPPPRRRSTAT